MIIGRASVTLITIFIRKETGLPEDERVGKHQNLDVNSGDTLGLFKTD